MLEVLSSAKQQVQAIEAVAATDLDARELEIWQHMPYLCKLNVALKDVSRGTQSVGIRALRGLVATGAYVSAVGSQLFGQTQAERDLKAIKRMMDEDENKVRY